MLKRFDAATGRAGLSMTGQEESFPAFALLFREKRVINVRGQVKRFDTGEGRTRVLTGAVTG
ncbi:hypothetical protein ACH47C_23035 [Streptomyces rishiriensis]|uniref:hypothetical protein n=1 Tax=Streptomyces rishiriensis TaxID=68264 RepID=UPI00379FCE7D